MIATRNECSATLSSWFTPANHPSERRMQLDQPEARPFERRPDASRSRRSWFANTAAVPTSLRVSSGCAIAAAGSVSPNGTGKRRGPRKPGSRSSGPPARPGIGLEEGSVPFLFHVSDARPVQERQKVACQFEMTALRSRVLDARKILEKYTESARGRCPEGC